MPILTTPNQQADTPTLIDARALIRRRRLAYLTSHYPAISHTFILNEIKQLRLEGFDIATASINACDRQPSKLPDQEQGEYRDTFYLKPSGLPVAISSAIISVLKNPRGVLRGLLFTLGLGGGPKRLLYFAEALMLGSWMGKRDLRHLHVHFGMAAATVGMIAAKTFPITYSLTIHGPDEFYDVGKFYLARKIETASFICCIGSFARSQLMKIAPSRQWDKLKITPLGVDTDRFRPLRTSSGDADEPLTVPFEILCVGRLVPAKGQHILVSAVRQLIDEGRNVRLRMVGDGPERLSLANRIADEGLGKHVILEGAMNQDRIQGFLKNADVFALASFAEGIPVALMEAMAMEIPCVSTIIAGIPELIRNEIDGLLVSPSDDSALADALRRLIDHPDTRRRLGKAGRLRVIERYNLENNVKALAEVYRCYMP